jgi:signal transduction histidine kinase
MIASFERRMAIVSAVVIGGGFVAIVIAITVLASAFYVGTLMRDEQDVVSEARTILTNGGLPADARRGGDILVDHFFRPQMRITVLDGTYRVQIYRAPSSVTMPSMTVQNLRNSVADDGGPEANSFLGRSTTALATVLGLHPERAQIGPLNVIVRVDPATLVADFWRVFPLIGIALVVAIGFAIALGRVLVHQALRPLNDVTAALERFALGDLTPHAITAHEGHRLSNLAKAYNGAIAQVQAAFAERDGAHAAMRQFLCDAGHQLRTPLTVVRGFIGILQKGALHDPADGERILQRMNAQCLLMGAMIDKLMLLEQWDNAPDVPAEPIDVVQLLEDVVAPIAESVPSRVVHLDLPQASALARIDPSDFTHALTNLLENALKYAPDAPITVALSVDAERIRIAVSDEGPGMTPAEAEHAFDRFFRGALHRDVAGSGLGLAIARRAVERANGTLSLETAPGRGSCFTIVLPRSPYGLSVPRYAAIATI